MKHKRMRPPKKSGRLSLKFGIEPGGIAPDLCVLWRDIPRCDRKLLLSYLCSRKTDFNLDRSERTFIQELVHRGYDLSTLNFTIDKKAE
jgi:hypothetical protein